MRLLRIEADGFFLFSGKIVIDFNAEQRVYPDNAAMLYNPFGSTYTNNVLSFVGVNASGKTTSLKLISFVMQRQLIIFRQKWYWRNLIESI